MFIPVKGEAPMVAPVSAHRRLAILQLSLMVGEVVLTTALQPEGDVFCVVLPGQEMVGAILSPTVTVKEQFVTFPPASVALYVMLVTPALNV